MSSAQNAARSNRAPSLAAATKTTTRAQSTWGVLALLASVSVLGGCAELRARHEARKGNDFFRDGDYASAVARYEESQRIFPEFPTSALNHGLACRQMMSVGSDSPESQQAADCALKAFKQLQQIAPRTNGEPSCMNRRCSTPIASKRSRRCISRSSRKIPKAC